MGIIKERKTIGRNSNLYKYYVMHFTLCIAMERLRVTALVVKCKFRFVQPGCFVYNILEIARVHLTAVLSDLRLKLKHAVENIHQSS